MVRLPWRRDDGSEASDEAVVSDRDHDDAVVVGRFQDGTVAVYEDEVVVERVSRSRFDDRRIPTAEIVGVDYSEGITIGYLQIEQTGVDVDAGGLLSDPVNPNTVHFGRGSREDARAVRDAILERTRG
ncbi:hypothetical protein EGH21_03105 [Halomicroarcula sp. F13]|uniref:Uncharacterized protein n=1 Tax=Haloarcula rubra TaxID=2487747 RepID=A0AAW4PMT1_9EURY|nr:hypothetical protein [Halomicroarcula rubra]MBX0322014.1 hypothetical protein [Halomicroarcula rubra]